MAHKRSEVPELEKMLQYGKKKFVRYDESKTFPNARVSSSINTLDEDFRREMDRGVSIERRIPRDRFRIGSPKTGWYKEAIEKK